ncbi:hypothetical protein IFR05_015125 [Cadophora sp. M221]|nr:hypothetical protein IFR05_015125 [Cadophora sp. M221]
MKFAKTLTFTSLLLCTAAFEPPLNPINGVPAAPPRRPTPNSLTVSIAGGTFHEGSKQTNKPGTTSTKTIKTATYWAGYALDAKTTSDDEQEDGTARPTGPDTPWTRRDTMKKSSTTATKTEIVSEPQEIGEAGRGGIENNSVADLESRPIPGPHV